MLSSSRGQTSKYERLFSEWFLIHKAKCFPEFIFHVNYLLSVQFQFCALPVPFMEKREGVNLVNFFLHFSQSLDIAYKISSSLCFQTADMYWLYDINGLPQVTIPPVNVKAKVDTTNKMFDNKPSNRHNFIYENAQITRTGYPLPSRVLLWCWRINKKMFFPKYFLVLSRVEYIFLKIISFLEYFLRKLFQV